MLLEYIYLKNWFFNDICKKAFSIESLRKLTNTVILMVAESLLEQYNQIQNKKFDEVFLYLNMIILFEEKRQ